MIMPHLPKIKKYPILQGWVAGAGPSRMFLAPWEPETVEKKKQGAGATPKKNRSQHLLCSLSLLAPPLPFRLV